VEALTDDPSAATGAAVDAACDPDAESLAERLAPEVRLHAYRVAQEALRNAVRHARAGRVSLRLALAPCAASRDAAQPAGEPAAPRLVLTVDDDGAGMPLPPDYEALLRAGHLGLASMRERAERIGADLAVTRGAAGGTRVSLAIPVPAVCADAAAAWPGAPLAAFPGPTPAAATHRAATAPVRMGV
jgi:signal transduction histidine kinase